MPSPSNTTLAIIQRVLSASVTVDKEVVSSIGQGLLVLAAVAPYDTPKDVEAIANKILKLKVWDDEGGGRWKRSVLDLDHQVLLVSQFTLLATTKKGNKPDFHGACPPAVAREIYASLLQKTRELYVEEKKLSPEAGSTKVQDGIFGAMMEVSLVNDGPVTFEISSPMKQVETPLGGGGGEGKTQGEKKSKATSSNEEGQVKLSEAVIDGGELNEGK
ncbi:D-Tyr tRNAtyr deacylase-like domain-containing protein [Tuber indicum]|nr:D-Tyr tRNAtyr deacylase-like domain-containing protein [Tuber indicum]